MRYVEPGNEAEISWRCTPGRIIKCKVDHSWATGKANADQRRTENAKGAAPERYSGGLVDGKDKSLPAAGARGHGASTPSTQFLHIIRKVFVRVSAKLDWFVAKLH